MQLFLLYKQSSLTRHEINTFILCTGPDINYTFPIACAHPPITTYTHAHLKTRYICPYNECRRQLMDKRSTGVLTKLTKTPNSTLDKQPLTPFSQKLTSLKILNNNPVHTCPVLGTRTLASESGWSLGTRLLEPKEPSKHAQKGENPWQQ